MKWHGNKSHLMVNFPCDCKKKSEFSRLRTKIWLTRGKQCPETGACITAIEDAVPEHVKLQEVHF